MSKRARICIIGMLDRQASRVEGQLASRLPPSIELIFVGSQKAKTGCPTIPEADSYVLFIPFINHKLFYNVRSNHPHAHIVPVNTPGVGTLRAAILGEARRLAKIKEKENA